LKKCWVCLRITPELTLKLAHQVWAENPKIAREIGLKSARTIEQCYHKKPTFLCGQTANSVLAGLFYLLGFQHQAFKSLKEIAKATNIVTLTVAISYRKWFNAFPELFPDFTLWKNESASYEKLYPTFKGKPVQQYHKEAKTRFLNE